MATADKFYQWRGLQERLMVLEAMPRPENLNQVDEIV